MNDGIVINGLAILCPDCYGRPIDYDLEEAFDSRIIGGQGSFVVAADGDAQFAKAVLRKLLLEIASVPARYGIRALKNVPMLSIAPCASGNTAALPCQPWIMSSHGS